MSTTTRCHVCGTAPAEGACDRCGARVCADHFDEDRGLCVACAGPGDGDLGPEAGGRR